MDRADIPIPDTWPAVVGGMHRSGRATILRRIRRFDLSFTVTTRRADLERFYDSMYEPHARRRFGHLAVVADRDEVVAPGAALLQVVQGDRVVSAGVVCQSENALCCLWDGVADGLGPDLAEAASGGLYYFQIQRAWAQGCREVNLGYTRPLLNDGVYWYKRKWGAGVHDVWRERELLLRPTRLGAGVESFFVHDPLIVRQNHRLVGKIMTDRDLLSRADVARLARSYLTSGIHCLKIFSTRPLGDDIVRPGAHEGLGPVQVIDLTACADPAASFCSA